jgi:hypothetical protein
MAQPHILPPQRKGALALLVGAHHKALPALAVGVHGKRAPPVLPPVQHHQAAPAAAVAAAAQRMPAPMLLELTPAYDVYGLGVTILEVLTGLHMSKMNEGWDRVLMPQALVDFRNGKVDAVCKAMLQRYPAMTDAQMTIIVQLCKHCVQARQEERCTAMHAYEQLLGLKQAVRGSTPNNNR